MKPEVLTIGLGYIGLPTSALIASHGTNVLGVDINQHVVDTINEGKIHIVEPDLDKMNDIITQGYTFIAYSVDIRMLDLSARNGVMNCASAISRNK